MAEVFMYGDLSQMGDASDMVTIPRWELEELRETERFMTALEAAGVDNWEGYDFARDLFNATKK